MNTMTFVLTTLTALTTVAANVLLRFGLVKAGGLGISGRGFIADLFNLAIEPVFVIGLALYGAAALLWFYVLSSSSLSTAYILLIAIAFVGVTAADVVFFGTSLNVVKILGIGTILVGILMVAFSPAS